MMAGSVSAECARESDGQLSAWTLSVHDLTKCYGATVALRDVSLGLRRGEVHALVGENGACKSTLVKILSGIVAPDTGRIQLEGAPFRPPA